MSERGKDCQVLGFGTYNDKARCFMRIICIKPPKIIRCFLRLIFCSKTKEEN